MECLGDCSDKYITTHDDYAHSSSDSTCPTGLDQAVSMLGLESEVAGLSDLEIRRLALKSLLPYIEQTVPYSSDQLLALNPDYESSPDAEMERQRFAADLAMAIAQGKTQDFWDIDIVDFRKLSGKDKAELLEKIFNNSSQA